MTTDTWSLPNACKPEAGQSLSKYDVADNVDLVSIVHQWEDYHTFKFGKPPKLFGELLVSVGTPKKVLLQRLGNSNRKNRERK